ncbi:hypothetical protein GYB59_21800, partial [bacterium]|nr:hypothetical protein [bacterium]
MSRKIFGPLSFATLTVCLASFCTQSVQAAELSAADKAVLTAAQQDQYSFIMFYRANDSATQAMHQVLQTTLSSRPDAVVVPVQIGDERERQLINQFDATRIPMPATAVVAPNGAVTTVFPQKVTPQQLTAAIVSKGQATCLKALQDRKIVLLCAQSGLNQPIPAGVQQFQADAFYKDRTQVVTLQASDPDEARFLNQLGLPTTKKHSVIAFMAPPGVMLGTYEGDVIFDVLAKRLAA